MIIRSLALNNVRSYAGKSTLEFAHGTDRNVTLIHGVNGAGKTSLFVALNWALFGDSFSYAGRIVNENALRNASAKDLASASAAVEFRHEGVDYYLQRGMAGHVTTDGSLEEREAGVELFCFDDRGNNKEVRFPKSFVDQLLPPAIRTFFFFDGDRISDFTRPGREQDVLITKAVNDMLQLELIDRAARHLKQISRSVEQLIAQKGSPEAKRIAKEMETVSAAIEKLEARKLAAQSDLLDAEARKAKVDESLKDVAHVADEAGRRERLEIELREKVGQIESCRGEVASATVNAVMIPARAELEKAAAFLEDKRRKGEVPANYKDQFLKDLLKQGLCICGAAIAPGSSGHDKIAVLLESALPGGIQDTATDLAAQVKRALRDCDAQHALLMRRLQDLESLEASRNELESEVQKIGDIFRGSILEQVQKFQDDRDQIERDIRQHAIGLSQIDRETQKLEKEVDELGKAFKQETDKEASLLELRRKADFAARSAKAFGEIRETLISQLKLDLSDAGTQIFKKFTWKVDYFDRISIGEDYLLSVLDAARNDLRDGMSMGETQLLSLAFILSMIAISEYEAPLVIDTPLARLSVEVRNNLLQALPKLTPQLVLLCTDTEMTADLRRILGDRVGAEYHLVFQDGVTNVLQGAPA